MESSMSKIEPDDANDGPVDSVDGLRPPSLTTGHGGAGRGALVPGQRWSVGRKREVVLRLLRGVAVDKLEQWRQKADTALDGALKEREADPASGELAAAMQRIGELSMENELLRSRIERPGPLGRRRSR